MTPIASNFKLNDLLIAMLVVISTQHMFVYRMSQVINIMLFDLIIFTYVVIFLRRKMVIYVDGWLKLFISMLFFQFVHNIFFSGDLLFVIRELVQSIELVVFYLILRKFLLIEKNFNRILDYVFCALSLISFITVLGYFDTSVTQSFGIYLKQSSIINMLVPIIILSFYYYKNYNYSTKNKMLVFLIATFSCCLGIISETRAFYVFLLLICLGYLFNKKRILLVTTILIGILSVIFFYQDNISNKYTSEYSEKVSQTVEHITNNKPFMTNGYNELMIIDSPSNRQRLHYFKLIYQASKNNLFTGLGYKQISSSNLHGNFFIYYVAFGLFSLFFFLVLVLNLYITSKKNLKVLPLPLNWMKHYYFLYAIVMMFFVGGGTFPLLPFIIAAALIKSTNKPRQSDFNNYYSIGSSA
jgi:hypothetical protein